MRHDCNLRLRGTSGRGLLLFQQIEQLGLAQLLDHGRACVLRPRAGVSVLFVVIDALAGDADKRAVVGGGKSGLGDVQPDARR